MPARKDRREGKGVEEVNCIRKPGRGARISNRGAAPFS